MPRISIVPVAVCHVLHSFNSNLVCIIQPFIFNSSVGNMYRIKHNPINWYNLQHCDSSITIQLCIKEVENNTCSDKTTLMSCTLLEELSL